MQVLQMKKFSGVTSLVATFQLTSNNFKTDLFE